MVARDLGPNSHAVKGGDPASRRQQESQNRQDIAQEPPSLFDLIVGRKLDQAGKYCSSKRQDDAEKWIASYWCGIKITDVYSALSAFVAMLVSACLLIVGFLQWRVVARQAEIMRRQANISADQLVAAKDAAAAAVASAEASRLALAHGREVFLSTERPWIKVQAKPLKLIFNENGCSLNILFFLTNVGSSPAANVLLHPRLVGPIFDGKTRFDPETIQLELSEQVRSNPPLDTHGEVIFPGDMVPLNCTVMFDKDKWDRMKEATELVRPHVVGCVGHSFVFEPGNHQTGFIYRCSRTDRPRPEAEAKNRVSAAIFWDEGDIAEGDLMLYRDRRGWYAD